VTYPERTCRIPETVSGHPRRSARAGIEGDRGLPVDDPASASAIDVRSRTLSLTQALEQHQLTAAHVVGASLKLPESEWAAA
jgi:hypothetical protein